MTYSPHKLYLLAMFLGLIASTPAPSFAADPLPSWNDTETKEAIVEFVEKVTKEGTFDFVPPAEREYAYDRDTHVGKLDKGLDEADKRGWVLIDMKKDWNQIYPWSGN